MTEMEKKMESSVKYQYLAAAVVNMLTMSYGITGGWASPALLLLMSDETPLPSGKITMDEGSWITSLQCVGGFIGNILFGYITANFGRKIPLMLMSIPIIISWTLILFAQNVNFLYASRLLNGVVGGGIFVIMPLYLSEIANDRVRGTLGSIFALSTNVGVLIAFTIGSFCDFFTTPIFVIILIVLYSIMIFWLPETAAFLMKQNKTKEAENSIRFYQNLHGKENDHILELEMNKLRNAFGKSNKCDGDSFKWTDLLSNPGRKAFIIGICLSLLYQLCGCYAILAYTATIFKESGSAMSPQLSAIIVVVIQLFGSIITTKFVDRLGRKILYVISTIGTSIGLFSLGLYVMLRSRGYDVESFNWVPIVSFSFVIFIASWGILSLPFVVLSEVMPAKLKDFGSSFCLTLIWFLAFVMMKCLPLLIQTLSFHGCMFLFSGNCIFSFILIVLFLPETKGKSHDEIMNMLR